MAPFRPSRAQATALAALALVGAFAGCLDDPRPGGTPPPPAGNTAGSGALVILNTSAGVVLLQVFSDQVPATAANFLNLTAQGYYDGTRFHRVIGPSKMPPAGFMLQGGDPLSRELSQRERWGFGGPNQTIPDEYPRDTQGGLLLRHDRPGTLSMANRGPNTANSQFFITLNETSWLDGKNAVFGRVVGGMDVARSIGEVPTDAQDRPLAEVLVYRVSVACTKCL